MSSLDLVVLAVYLVGIVAFGLWMGRRQHGLADFAVGGRDAPWWIVLFSIVATETSTVTFLSVPGFAYAHDLTWLQLPLGFVLGRFLVIAWLLPQYFRGELFTAYDVLERRFGGATKRVASALFVLTRNAADGLRLFLTAIVLEQVAGCDLGLAIACIGLTTIAYTFAGGIRAVLWTDFVQFLVYVLGAIVAFAVLLDRIPGGWGEVHAAAAAAGKLRVFDFTLDLTQPQVFWAGLVGGAFLSLGTHGADQMMVQRYLCARRQGDAALALGASGFVVLAQMALFLLIGIALWAFYRLPVDAFGRSDRVFAAFIAEEMPPGLRGVLLGAVFAAAMSTLSSSLNSSATAALHDLYLPLCEPDASPKRALRLARAFTVLFGFVQIAVGLAGQWTREAVVDNVLAIASFTTGILLGLFFLGTFTVRVGQRAALIALVTGLGTMTAVQLTTALAWPWFSLVGSLVTFATGCVAAHVLRDSRT